MASVTNPDFQQMIMPSQHVVPGRGKLITTNEVLRLPDNARWIENLTVAGIVSVTYDPDPEDATAVVLPSEPTTENPPEPVDAPKAKPGKA